MEELALGFMDGVMEIRTWYRNRYFITSVNVISDCQIRHWYGNQHFMCNRTLSHDGLPLKHADYRQKLNEILIDDEGFDACTHTFQHMITTYKQ